MTKVMFTEAQRKELVANPNVFKVIDRSITSASAFKVKAVKENQERKSPSHTRDCEVSTRNESTGTTPSSRAESVRFSKSGWSV
ncbi:hypothetical protein [Salimicrobium jeotgali]|uniref:hypothetical protein n=1 Tax=Salimicrobium jeotgali TaxID=1230341 RepID=UPI000C86308B|nr:hypothetical protein [Salimicrobium jeotgali]